MLTGSGPPPLPCGTEENPCPLPPVDVPPLPPPPPPPPYVPRASDFIWNQPRPAGEAGFRRQAYIHERIDRFVSLVGRKTAWNFKTTWQATASPLTYAYRSVVKGEKISMWEAVMGVGAWGGFAATATAGLAATTTWESVSNLLTYYVVNNAGLPVDWVALGTGVAVSVALRGAGIAAAAFVGVGVGSFLGAVGEASYDAVTWHGYVYE